MPHVADLALSIAEESGLDVHADEAVIIRALNRANRSIMSRVPAISLTAQQSVIGDGVAREVSIASFERVDAVMLCLQADVATGPYAELHQSSMDAVTQGTRTSGDPTCFSQYGRDAILLDAPLPAEMALVIHGSAYPLPLDINTDEGDIAVPIPFHEDALQTLALTHILEGYEGDEQRASYYRNLAVEAIDRLKSWALRRYGIDAPNSRSGAPHFHTPPPLEIR